MVSTICAMNTQRHLLVDAATMPNETRAAQPTWIDGIAANDPAASGEFRFETLQSDGIERIELLRGPQSALWGSEAIGGVVSVTTRLPGTGPAAFGQAEAGSFGTYRASGGINIGKGDTGLVAQMSHSSSDGIDAFGAGGERDGYRNTTLSLKGIVRPIANGAIGLIVRHADADSQFDGSPRASSGMNAMPGRWPRCSR